MQSIIRSLSLGRIRHSIVAARLRRRLPRRGLDKVDRTPTRFVKGSPDVLPDQAEGEHLHAGETEQDGKLALSIADLDLSVRASNCLEAENIRTVGDLVRLSIADLLAMKNFGKTSLREVEIKLKNTGLNMDMDVDAILGEGAGV